VTTTPTPQQVGRVQAAIDRILDGDADRYVGAYYNAEARSYPTAKGVLFAGRYFDELQTNNVRAFTVGDLAAASLLDVRFGPHVVLEILEREECNTLLTDIPSDLLARKRPHLMPILDSVIIDALHLEGLDGWLALRAALTPALRRRIDELAQAATDQGAARPSTLRLLDVATWMMHSQSRQAKAVRTAWAR